MTDTNRHDKPADRRSRARARGLHQLTQKVRDGQGQLLLFSQFPGDSPANHRGYFLRRSKS